MESLIELLIYGALGAIWLFSFGKKADKMSGKSRKGSGGPRHSKRHVVIENADDFYDHPALAKILNQHVDWSKDKIRNFLRMNPKLRVLNQTEVQVKVITDLLSRSGFQYGVYETPKTVRLVLRSVSEQKVMQEPAQEKKPVPSRPAPRQVEVREQPRRPEVKATSPQPKPEREPVAAHKNPYQTFMEREAKRLEASGKRREQKVFDRTVGSPLETRRRLDPFQDEEAVLSGLIFSEIIGKPVALRDEDG